MIPQDHFQHAFYICVRDALVGKTALVATCLVSPSSRWCIWVEKGHCYFCLRGTRRYSKRPVLSSKVFPGNYSVTVVNLLASQGERGTVVTLGDYADNRRMSLEKPALRGKHGHPLTRVMRSNSFTSEGAVGQSGSPKF